jgi:predicted nucleotidyltransferase
MTEVEYHSRTNALVEQLVDRLTTLLQGHQELQAAYLFGSRARGTQMTASDVDIAVAFAPEASAWTEVDLQERLTSQLSLPVQIVNLAHAAPDVIEAVRRDGIPLIGDHLLAVDKRRTIRERRAEYSQADEAIWLLQSAADKVRRIDSALPLLADVDPQAVLAGEMVAVRDFLGAFMLLIEPLETLVRRVSRYAHLVLGYEQPDVTLRAQTELAAQVMAVADEVLEMIGEMARLRGRLAHAYWDLDAEEVRRLAPEQLQPALEHFVERASRFVLREQARWQRPTAIPPPDTTDRNAPPPL